MRFIIMRVRGSGSFKYEPDQDPTRDVTAKCDVKHDKLQLQF